MQYTIFKCDKCGQEWRTDSEKCPQRVCLELSLTFGSHAPDTNRFGRSKARYASWCRPCVLSSGVSEKFFEPEPDSATKTIPTTEEVIVDMLEQLGFRRGE